MKMIKRIFCIMLTALFACAVLPHITLAQSGLSIESSKVYDGMDKSYSQGYMPRVSNGTAYIVLPLVGNTNGDIITVTPQLDTDAPFVYGNYQFNVKKANSVYLVKLNLPLKSDRQNGLYPVTFNISYELPFNPSDTAEPIEAQQSFTVYVSISDAKKAGQAELFISDSLVTPSLPMPNDDITCMLTLENIGSETAQKVRVTYDGDEIVPKTAQNIIRTDDIPKSGQITVSFKMRVSPDAESGRHSFSVSVTYSDANEGHELSKLFYVNVGAIQVQATSGSLSIETKKAYKGMSKSYAKGYLPTVRDGKVQIVLPLVGDTKNNAITITPDIGTDSAMEYANYRFNVAKKDGIYLISLALTLKKERVNGLYPVVFNVEYATDDGDREQSFTVFVSITDGAETPDSAELFIQKYKINPAKVNGGDDFEVSLTLENIGGSPAQKIRVTYDGAEGEFGKLISPKKAVNILRVDDIAAGKTTTVKFKMNVSKDAIAGRQPFTVQISFSEGELVQGFTVNVLQPLDVSVDEIQMPQEVVSGESIILPISILNKGKAAIYDVTCKLEMDGCYGSSVYIGQVQAGTTGYAEMKVFVGTLSQGSLYGGTFGELHITYKEADGSEYTDTTELRTTITEPQTEDDNQQYDDEERPALQPVSQWYVSVIVGIAVIAIAVAVIIVVSYQRRLRLK